MSNVDVSVIIPAYNAIKYIGRAIESIQIQLGLSWELIVVENGSTDDTINNNNLRFDSKLTLAEDSDFTFRYMQCIKSAIDGKSACISK